MTKKKKDAEQTADADPEPTPEPTTPDIDAKAVHETCRNALEKYEADPTKKYNGPYSVSVKFKGGSMVHTGRGQQHEYRFGGETPVLVTDPKDMAFFTRKAWKNPGTWELTDVDY